MSISIQQSGLLASVQDLGRPLQQAYGIGSAGALDPLAHQLAQILVANPVHAAGIELFAGPFRLQTEQACWLGISGAEIDGEICLAETRQPVISGWRYALPAGAQLQIHGLKRGRCCYLSFSGGIAVPTVLGSRSTDFAAQFGGWLGQALQAGARLPLGLQNDSLIRQTTGVRQPVNDGLIRLLPGPEWSQLKPESQRALLRQAWPVSAQSNRMGLRLNPGQPGQTPLQLISPIELLSHAVFPGVMQLPAQGWPIILLADAQCTGGYPRIATVIQADLWKLAQSCPGQVLHFQLCDLAQAQHAALEQQNWLKQIRYNLQHFSN